MEIQQYLDKMKSIYEHFLAFIDDDSENSYELLIKQFTDFKIGSNKYDLKTVLHMISQICADHYRTNNFFDKIIKVLRNFSADIKRYYSHREIYNLFKDNPRILLALYEEKVFGLTKYIKNSIINHYDNKFKFYFSPELNKEKATDDFNQKRKKGENDSVISQIIREDSLNEFIEYVNKNSVSLDDDIKRSKFDTNRMNMEPPIVHAAFFGSAKIFKYLISNKFDVTKINQKNLVLYAIHGRNPEIIHILEDKNVESYENDILFREAIRDHHNDLAHYYENKLTEPDKTKETLNCILKNYNFEFIEKDMITKSNFNLFCKYDYYFLCQYLLKNEDINVNDIKILKKNFFLKNL